MRQWTVKLFAERCKTAKDILASFAVRCHTAATFAVHFQTGVSFAVRRQTANSFLKTFLIYELYAIKNISFEPFFEYESNSI